MNVNKASISISARLIPHPRADSRDILAVYGSAWHHTHRD